MSTSSSRTVVEAQATLRRELERQWRAWSALVTELDAEMQQAQRAGSPDAALFDAPPALKANLPAATRKQLMGTFDLRLQATQAEADTEARRTGAEPPDAEAIRHRLITHLGRELRGEVHEKGLALVWWNGKLVPFDHRSLQRATATADYLAAGLSKAGGGPVQTAAIIGGGVLALFVALWFIVNVLFAPTRTPQTTEAAPARVGDQTITRWDAREAGGVAGMRVLGGGTGYPLVTCAPEAAAGILTGTVAITGTANVRHYALGPSGPDLQVVACERLERELARGTLTAAFQALPAEPGDGRVNAVWVRGPSLDPQRIPANRMEVTVQVSGDVGETTLVLADGTAIAPSERRPAGDGADLIYLAPLLTVAQAAGLHEHGLGALPVVTPLTIPAPEDRRSYLTRVMTATDVQAEREGALLRVTVTLQATTDHGEAVTLQGGDVQAMSQGKVLTPVWQPVVLSGDGAPADLVVTLPVSDAPITLAIGPWQASIQP